MKALPQVQPTIYELLQGGSYQRLRSAFAQFDIKVDPRTLILNNQTKESVLSQILTDLETSPKLVNLANVTQEYFNPKAVQEYLSEKKSIEDSKIFSFMRCLQMYFLTQEAAQHYFKMEQLKVLQQELRTLLLKLASAEYERQVQIAETEKMKILEAQRSLNDTFSKIFHDAFEPCFNQLSEIKGKVLEYNNTLKQLKEEKQAIKSEMQQDSLLKAKELKQSCPELDNVSEAELADFIYKERRAIIKAESAISRYEQKNEHIQKLNQDIDKELAILDQKQTALDKEELNAKHLYGGAIVATKHEKNVRIPESMRLDFQLRKEEIKAYRQHLLEKKNANNLDIEKHNQKIANVERNPERIMQALLAKDENQHLRAAFQHPNVREKFTSMIEQSSHIDEKFKDNRKQKYVTKIQQKHLVKQADELAQNQLYPARALSAVNGQHLQPQQQAAAATKASQIHDLVKGIRSAAEELQSERKKQRRAEKLQHRTPRPT